MTDNLEETKVIPKNIIKQSMKPLLDEEVSATETIENTSETAEALTENPVTEVAEEISVENQDAVISAEVIEEADSAEQKEATVDEIMVEEAAIEEPAETVIEESADVIEENISEIMVEEQVEKPITKPLTKPLDDALIGGEIDEEIVEQLVEGNLTSVGIDRKPVSGKKNKKKKKKSNTGLYVLIVMLSCMLVFVVSFLFARSVFREDAKPDSIVDTQSDDAVEPIITDEEDFYESNTNTNAVPDVKVEEDAPVNEELTAEEETSEEKEEKKKEEEKEEEKKEEEKKEEQKEEKKEETNKKTEQSESSTSSDKNSETKPKADDSSLVEKDGSEGIQFE